eukprot:TRINITY_DN71_c0_g1_i1.p1 TRINITY_DN71_c0_g1~~TRINITY_DN71_c0_g1_i1.p1  ORF type:complete len:873 (+),score=351.99 TRINITY_DN71_c0_g1_i1:140-2758(+)
MAQPVDKIPSNDEIVKGMEKEVHILDKVEHDPSMTYKGERIIEDVKRVIKDEEALVQQRNSGDAIQNLIKHSYTMAVELAHDERINGLFENWGGILASAAQTGDWSAITKAVGSIATDLRNTESFIVLLNELKHTLQLLVAHKVDSVTSAAEKAANSLSSGVEKVAEAAHDAGAIKGKSADKVEDVAEKVSDKTEAVAEKARSLVHDATGVKEGSSSPMSDKKYDKKQDKQRKKLIHNLTLTLDKLSKNSTWMMIKAKGQDAKETVQKEGIEPALQIAAAISESSEAKQVLADFKATLQNLVGGKEKLDVEPCFQHSQALINKLLNDKSYADLLHKLQDQLGKIVEQPQLLEEKATLDQAQKLFDELRDKLDQLQNDADLVAAQRETKTIVDAIMHDPLAAKLIRDTRTLIGHIVSLKPGQLVDPDLLIQLRGLLVPLLVEHLKEVPLPQIDDFADTPIGKYEYTLDNMKVDISEILPNNIHLKFKYDLDAHPRTLSYNHQHAVVIMEVRDIQLKLKDIHWSYNRLTIPHVQDSGTCDVRTGGHGFCVRIKMAMNHFGAVHTNDLGQKIETKDIMTMRYADCWIDRWHIDIHDSKHNKLYELLMTMYQDRLKKAVQDKVLEKIRGFVSNFNHGVYVLLNEARIKQSDARYQLQAKAHDAQDAFKHARRQAKTAIANSAPVAAAKDAAIHLGKEAVIAGFEAAKDAPNLAAAVVSAGAKVKDAVENSNIGQDVLKVAGDVKEKAGEVVDAVKDKAGDAVDAVKDKAGDAVDATKDKAGEVKDAVKEKAGEAKDAVKEKAGEIANETEEARHKRQAEERRQEREAAELEHEKLLMKLQRYNEEKARSDADATKKKESLESAMRDEAARLASLTK